MFNTNFSVMNEVIQVRAVLEFLHQNCDKLIAYGGDFKHNSAVKPLPILNTGSFTTFLPTSLNETVNNSFPTNVCFLM